MALEKMYRPDVVEPELQRRWASLGIYKYLPDSLAPVFSVDTPPPTVSGFLHLGHVYSYSHTDFIVRFKRMRGFNIFYPMGFDDNGLPTERLVEKKYGITAEQVGRESFIAKCLEISTEVEADYEELWKRLALSIDWRFAYRTIDENSRRTSQLSFIDLYRNGYLNHTEAPAIWCPECETALAQADLNDLIRETEYVTLLFRIEGEQPIKIATTRPELLPACAAIFVHPDDPRYSGQVGKIAYLPIFDRPVPILADTAVEPDKGTGAVMCCTFGDQTDVAWWRAYKLPIFPVLSDDGVLTPLAGKYSGLTSRAAQKAIKDDLLYHGLLIDRTPTQQSVRVHERCDHPVEYIIKKQWFIRVLDFRAELLDAGRKILWHPAHMENRFLSWVENLNWDWNISRQRYFGVPFPVWFCKSCQAVVLASENQLPVDPTTSDPQTECPHCGSQQFLPETDVMDTWATSSMSPQIVARWLQDPALYAKVFPMDLRPQGHEIIRTWAFYTLVKSIYHFDALPWKNIALSGWGIAAEGEGKISKSRGGGPMPPLEMIEKYSADAVRYWTSSTGSGKDAVISEEKIQLGGKLVTKLWNVARFAERFINQSEVELGSPIENLSPADLWILARLQVVIQRATDSFEDYEYAAAKNEVESYFWQDLADNYLEMAKQRLYEPGYPGHAAAVACLNHVLLDTLKLFAPFFPHITEQIYLELFAEIDHTFSIHTSTWPQIIPEYQNEQALQFGALLVEIATAVRRYKSEHNQSPGTPLEKLQMMTVDATLPQLIERASSDLCSVTRAKSIEISSMIDPTLTPILKNSQLEVVVYPS